MKSSHSSTETSPSHDRNIGSSPRRRNVSAASRNRNSSSGGSSGGGSSIAVDRAAAAAAAAARAAGDPSGGARAVQTAAAVESAQRRLLLDSAMVPGLSVVALPTAAEAAAASVAREWEQEEDDEAEVEHGFLRNLHSGGVSKLSLNSGEDDIGPVAVRGAKSVAAVVTDSGEELDPFVNNSDIVDVLDTNTVDLDSDVERAFGASNNKNKPKSTSKTAHIAPAVYTDVEGNETVVSAAASRGPLSDAEAEAEAEAVLQRLIADSDSESAAGLRERPRPSSARSPPQRDPQYEEPLQRSVEGLAVRRGGVHPVTGLPLAAATAAVYLDSGSEGVEFGPLGSDSDGRLFISRGHGYGGGDDAGSGMEFDTASGSGSDGDFRVTHGRRSLGRRRDGGDSDGVDSDGYDSEGRKVIRVVNDAGEVEVYVFSDSDGEPRSLDEAMEAVYRATDADADAADSDGPDAALVALANATDVDADHFFSAHGPSDAAGRADPFGYFSSQSESEGAVLLHRGGGSNNGNGGRKLLPPVPPLGGGSGAALHGHGHGYATHGSLAYGDYLPGVVRDACAPGAVLSGAGGALPPGPGDEFYHHRNAVIRKHRHAAAAVASAKPATATATAKAAAAAATAVTATAVGVNDGRPPSSAKANATGTGTETDSDNNSPSQSTTYAGLKWDDGETAAGHRAVAAAAERGGWLSGAESAESAAAESELDLDSDLDVAVSTKAKAAAGAGAAAAGSDEEWGGRLNADEAEERRRLETLARLDDIAAEIAAGGGRSRRK